MLEGVVIRNSGIIGGNKTRLIVINGNINAQTYINDGLAVEAILFIQFQMSLLMHNNFRPLSAATTGQFLATNKVNVLDWLANSPDLNPVEQVWDELRRRIRRNHATHTVNNLAATLQSGWANLTAPFIQRNVNSMRRRKTACILLIGGHMRY